MINILTNDPSITAWGWAVVSLSGVIKETGCIKTQPDNTKKNLRKSDDRMRRISEINTRLLQVIKRHNVEYILSEIPHGSQSATSAIAIGNVVGMVQTMADTLELPLEGYSEGEVKKFLLGKRAAGKEEMIACIEKQGVWKQTGKKGADEAVADALGVYYTALVHSETLKLFKRLKAC